MSNLLVSPKWNSFINKVDAGEEITGGDFGNANIATRQLAENVMFLRDSMFTLVTDATTDLTETVENLEIRTKGEFDKIANEIATQNSLIIAESKARKDEISLANSAIAKEAEDRILALDEANNSLQTEIDERKAAIRAENLSRAESEAKFTQTLEETLDINEAAVKKIDNLSAQLVGGYDGSDLDFITEGLLFQQKSATATALKGMSEQISMLSAGVGEQFDLKEIWHFTKDKEKWVNGTFETGYLTVKNETITSPVFDVDGDVYHHLKMRINRIGSPTWQGLLTWEGGSISIPTPIFIEDITVVTLDTKWVGNITQMQLKLATVADANNYYKIDWISIGRPSPGASMAGLLEVKQASATRDEALAQSITALDAKLNTDTALLGSDFNKKIETLTTEQQTQATELTNIKSTVETLDQELSAEITLNNNTLVTKQTALAESIAALKSSTDDAAATLLTDLKTLTDKDTALANQLTALTASLDTTKAGIVTQNKVFADKDTALTNSITQLTSKVDGNIAEVNTKIETITTDNSAAASKFDSLTAQFDDLVLNVDSQELEIRKNTADIITNERVRAEAELAQSERIDLLTAEVGTNAASAAQRINTLVTADTALSERLDVLSAKTDSSEATVNNRLTALAEADSAFTEQVNQLIAEVDGNAAAANQKFTALTDTDESLAEQLTQLTADFDNNSAAITAQLKTLSDKDSSQASQLSGLSASYAIVDTRSKKTEADLVDVNGELIEAKKIISKNTADLKLEQTARADKDTSIVQSITNLTATVAGNKSDIDVKYNTTTDAVSANASAILALKGTVGENKVAADQQFTAVVTAAQTEATKLEKLTGKVGTNTSELVRLDTAISNAEGSIVTAKEELTSSYTSAINRASSASATDAQKKADAAKSAAETYAAAQAKAKADAALITANSTAQEKANAAESAAKAAAALDAKKKADAALAAAKIHADNAVKDLKTIVDSKATISRVDQVENNANQALASAKTEITGSYTTAINTAKTASATDAQNKANKALADAKEDSADKVAALKIIVDSKASVTSVEKVVNDANQALATVEGKVTSAYSKAIEEIEVGGRNYFILARNPFYSYVKSIGNGIYTNTATTSSFALLQLQEPALAVGSDCVFSMYAKANTELVGWANSTFYLNGGQSVNHNAPTFILNEWVRVIAKFKLVQESNLVHIYIKGLENVGDIEFKNIKLEKGNKVTDWTPAPEDVTDYIDSEVGKLNTTIDSKADINTVNKVVSDANQSLAELKTSITGEYTKAIGTSQTASFLEAKSKADKALADAKADATKKADAAKDAAAEFTRLEAKAKADAALALASDDATDKANAAKSAAELAAAKDAKAKADKALTDAKADATTKANAAEKAAKAYADTKAEGLTTLISSKADIDVVNKIKNDTDGAIAQQKTDITASYKKAIDDIEIGGRNLQEDSKKFYMGGAAPGITTSITPEGWLKIVAVQPNSNWLSSPFSVASALNKLSIGDTITISLEVMATADGDSFVDLHVNGAMTYQRLQGKFKANNFVTLSQTRVVHALRNEVHLGLSAGSGTIFIKSLKIERGNKATDWSPAPEDVQESIDATTKLIEKESLARSNAIKDTLKDAKDYSNQLDSVIKGSFKDGLIDEAEAISIKAHINELNTQKNDLDQKFTTIYANTDLVGTAKTNLNSAKVALNSKYTDLVNYINSVTSNGKVTKAQSEAVSTKFTAYADALKLLSQRFEEANDSIVTKAKSDAVSSAKSYTDGVVAPLKKDVDSKASVTRVEQAEGYADRAIGESSKTITASYKKAIDDIEIGGRNLMLTSEEYSRTLGRRYGGIEESFLGYKDVGYVNAPKSTMYGFNQNYSESAVLGNNYTFSIFVTYVGAKPSRIELYDFGASYYTLLAGVENMQEGKWTRLTLTRSSTGGNFTGNHHMHVFTTGNSPSKVYFARAKVERGTTATDWTPAPEDITSAIEGTIETIKKVEATANGVKAEASSIITVGNKITGWKNLNDGKTSSFDILDDNFSVGNSTTSKKPFKIVGNDIEFNGKVSFNSVVGDVPGSRIANGTLDLNKLNSTDKSLINTASSNASSALSKAGTAQSRADSAWSKAGTAETNAKTHTDNALKNTIYYPNSTTIDGNKIQSGTILANKLSVNSLSALSANMGAITSGSLNINNKFIVDSSGNMTATSGKFSGTVLASKIEGKVANIEKAAVDTLQIELEAVTVPRLFYYPWTRQIFFKASHTLDYTLDSDARVSRGSKNGLPEGDILTMSLGTATFDAMGGSVSIQAFADDLEFSIPDSNRGVTGFDAVAGYCLFGLTLQRTDKAEPLREVTKVAWDSDRPQAPQSAKHNFTIPPVLDYPPSGVVTYEVFAWVYHTDRRYDRYTFKTIKNKVIISVGSVSVQIIGTKR